METAQHHFKILSDGKKKKERKEIITMREIRSISGVFTCSVMFLKQVEGRRRLLLVNTGISLLFF